MSLLYKDEKDLKYSIQSTYASDGKLYITLDVDCGKHGTDELIREYFVTPEQFMEAMKPYEAD